MSFDDFVASHDGLSGILQLLAFLGSWGVAMLTAIPLKALT